MLRTHSKGTCLLSKKQSHISFEATDLRCMGRDLHKYLVNAHVHCSFAQSTGLCVAEEKQHKERNNIIYHNIIQKLSIIDTCHISKLKDCHIEFNQLFYLTD